MLNEVSLVFSDDIDDIMQFISLLMAYTVLKATVHHLSWGINDVSLIMH